MISRERICNAVLLSTVSFAGVAGLGVIAGCGSSSKDKSEPQVPPAFELINAIPEQGVIGHDGDLPYTLLTDNYYIKSDRPRLSNQLRTKIKSQDIQHLGTNNLTRLGADGSDIKTSYVHVNLPANRCQIGTITFEIESGDNKGVHQAEALGRGRTRFASTNTARDTLLKDGYVSGGIFNRPGPYEGQECFYHPIDVSGGATIPGLYQLQNIDPETYWLHRAFSDERGDGTAFSLAVERGDLVSAVLEHWIPRHFDVSFSLENRLGLTGNQSNKYLMPVDMVPLGVGYSEGVFDLSQFDEERIYKGSRFGFALHTDWYDDFTIFDIYQGMEAFGFDNPKYAEILAKTISTLKQHYTVSTTTDTATTTEDLAKKQLRDLIGYSEELDAPAQFKNYLERWRAIADSPFSKQTGSYGQVTPNPIVNNIDYKADRFSERYQSYSVFGKVQDSGEQKGEYKDFALRDTIGCIKLRPDALLLLNEFIAEQEALGRIVVLDVSETE